MARAIRQISKQAPNVEEEQAQAAADLMRQLTENKDAVIAGIQVMKGLNDMGIFDALRGMLDNRTEVGAIAMQQLNQPATHNVIKAGMFGIQFLSTLQLGQLETVMNGVGLGMKRLSKTGQEGEKQSIWKMRRRLRSPEIRAAMTAMVDFMEGMGEAFLHNKKHNE
ncbi:hypothetical protein CVD28_08135 [Bacillus sp. M6-12]|uniref:DUF1641 domain-containing protein n=1 Tax=Bacillus sp. M6-12 TaxID=2054166 RepID=UPI000C75CD6E|nr:DUF1641 domain-containing protein [Bacillus sp. M6-12]PLS18246.1 hypothetical protein CVD28_08135 [Bacillus sp. M6-12]